MDGGVVFTRKSSRTRFRVWWIAARIIEEENFVIERASKQAGEDNVNCSSDLLAMASLMRQLQSKAAVATELAAKHGSTFYKRLLEENKQYIQQEPTVQKCQELSKQLFYTRLARFLFLVITCVCICVRCVCVFAS